MTICTTCARANVDCPVYPQQADECVEYRGESEKDLNDERLAMAREMTMKTMVVHGDGVTDDTEALQAFLDGKAKLVFPDGEEFIGDRKMIDHEWGNGRKFKISKALVMR